MVEGALTPATIVFWSIIAACLPALFYTLLIYWIDRYEKEPWGLLAATFLWGAVPAVLIAFVAEAILSPPLYVLFQTPTADLIAGGAIAPIVEETAKAVALILLVFRWRHEIDSPLDGIIYGAMVGMGFAVVENVYYFISVYLESGAGSWTGLVFVRALVFGLNHALYTAMTGLGVAIAWLSRSVGVRIAAPLAGWALAVFLHSLHNVAVSLPGSLAVVVSVLFDWGGLALTALIIIGLLYQERRWMQTYLADEVTRGTLTAEQYTTARSSLRRNQYRLQELARDGIGGYRQAGRFYQRCSELAYQKRRFLLFNDPRSGVAVEQLRAEIETLSA